MRKGYLNKIDWLLLIIASADKEELSPVQLQKSVFLVGEEVGISKRGYYKFKPYDYGPFSNEVYSDAEELSQKALVNISLSNNSRWKLYSITKEGLSAVEEINKILDPAIMTAIREKVKWVLSLDFRDLVLEVYRKYPKYRANSVFRG